MADATSGGYYSQTEGYVYHSYGHERYLRHVLASVSTLRRYDDTRPVALYCSESHREALFHRRLDSHFSRIITLPAENRSIIGFKHAVSEFMPFDCNLYLDSDMVWCRDPEALWKQLCAYRFTITGHERADLFFGTSKGAGVILEFLLNRRQRTLQRFGLTHLPRVQSGMMFAQDKGATRLVCRKASEFLSRKAETHFRSRLAEHGRSLESCEWSLAMAMSCLQMPVFPWFQGLNSPQLDFVEPLTVYDPHFTNVSCRYYCDRQMQSLRGLKSSFLREMTTAALRRIPGKGDYMNVTPFTLHFGWLHQKQPFYQFADSVWDRLIRQSDKETSHSN